MAGAVMAQVVARDESALVYYSPKTDVVLNFNYTVERQEAGIYAQYAESMLGVKEWVKETRTTHRLNDVRITTHTSTDYNRPHKVSANAGIPMLLNINAKGLLVGYNVPLDKSEKKAFPKHPQEKAVCILLTLLTLGIKNIYVGPTLPAFFSEAVIKFLVDAYHLHPVTSSDQDMKAMLRGN